MLYPPPCGEGKRAASGWRSVPATPTRGFAATFPMEGEVKQRAIAIRQNQTGN